MSTLQHEGPNRHPFAAVVSLRDRITVAGTEELVRKVLAKEAPKAMLPGDWSCVCVIGPEWSGSPNPDHPDSEWLCDGCGRIISATH